MCFLEDIKKELQKCVRCGKCRSFCPTLTEKKIEHREIPGWETRTPRGRVNIAKGLLEKKIKPNQQISELFFNCLFCAYCVNACPSGVDVNHIIEKTRLYLLENGYAPGPINSILNILIESKNIFGLDQEDRAEWTEFNIEEIYEDRINKPAEIGFFVGCQGSYKGTLSLVSEGISLVLDKYGYDFTILGEEEWCCGNPIHLLGIEDDRFLSFAKHNVEMLEKLNVKTVIATCPGCFRMLSKIYPRYLGTLPFKVIHSSQFLANLIKEKGIKITNEFNYNVGFQDPCELGRHCNVFEEPREVIKSIPGINFIELKNNRMESQCCGGGGLAKVIDEHLATEIAKFKIQAFQDKKIDTIVTSCQGCYLNLLDGNQKNESNLIIRDLNDLIAELLDLT